jgi:hypothetical protein
LRTEITEWFEGRWQRLEDLRALLPGGWHLGAVDPDGTPPAGAYAVLNVLSEDSDRTTEELHGESVLAQVDLYAATSGGVIAARNELLRGSGGLLRVADEAMDGGDVVTTVEAGLGGLGVEAFGGPSAERLYRQRVDLVISVSRGEV